MTSRITPWICIGGVLCGSMLNAGELILEFGFDDMGTTTISTGASMAALNFLDMTTAPADLHSAAGLGVAGDIVGHPAFGIDRSFDNTASFKTTGRLGGIAVNTVDESVSALTSWTVSGWYKTELADDPLSGGGTVLFQSPITFSTLPDGSPGISSAGFAVRAENPNGIRTTVNGINTGTGSAGNTWTDTQKWVFFAVSYDGTQSVGNIHYYRGYRNESESGSNPMTVTEVAFDTVNAGKMIPAHGLAIGNRTEDMNRAFDGYLDNIRVYGALDDNTGALGLAQIELIRAGDVVFGDGDFDGDGDVDGSDFLIWQRGFGSTSASLADGDATGDGTVDSDDLAVWKIQYGSGNALIAAVPEPVSLVMLTAALGSICLRTRAFRIG